MPARANGKPRLDAKRCAPLVGLLQALPRLGGEKGDLAAASAADLLSQAEWIQHYFGHWKELQSLSPAVTLELIMPGPVEQKLCALLVERPELIGIHYQRELAHRPRGMPGRRQVHVLQSPHRHV